MSNMFNEESHRGVDLVDEVVQRREHEAHIVDLVAQMWANPHHLWCPGYKPEVDRYGTVYCSKCHNTVGSLNSMVGVFCPRCSCARNNHNQVGKCLECGSFCGRDGALGAKNA